MLFGAARPLRGEKAGSEGEGGGGRKRSHICSSSNTFFDTLFPLDPSNTPLLLSLHFSSSLPSCRFAAGAAVRGGKKQAYVCRVYEDEKVQNEYVSPFILASHGLNARRYNNVDVTKIIHILLL